MNNRLTEIDTLLDAIWHEVGARRDKTTGNQVEVPAVTRTAAEQSESRFDAGFPVLRHLDHALTLARGTAMAAIAERCSALLDRLNWSQNPSYNEANSSPSFLAGYAYAALSGPEGPVYCTAPRGGFMLMGPNVTYPDHQHAPREVYLVMTPGVQWRLDQGAWFDVAPGDLMYHHSWQMHAMRTADRPLLAFAGWLDPGRRVDIEWGG